MTLTSPTGMQTVTCSSATDVTDAQTVAVDVAYENGLTIPTSSVTVNTAADTVSVADSVSEPSILAAIDGVHSGTQEAGADATVSTPSTSTGTSTSTSDRQSRPRPRRRQSCGHVLRHAGSGGVRNGLELLDLNYAVT